MTLVYLNTENIAEGVSTATVAHDLNSTSAIVARVLANWLTNIKVSSRTANTMVFDFSNAAPAAARIDVRIIS